MSKRVLLPAIVALLLLGNLLSSFRVEPVKATRAIYRGAYQYELSFTFNSPDHPWNESELATLQTWINDFYPTAKKIYGHPAFNMTINISQDPDSPSAGTYWFGKVVLKHPKADVFVHEMLHAFHSNYTICLDSWEEGMTRAAEVEIFDQLEAYVGDFENHSYYIDVYYEHDNQPDVAAKDGNFWQGYINVLQRYELAGYAWAKPLLENSSFFVDFNEMYYSQASEDISISFDESRLKDIVRQIKPTIEGQDFDTWYAKQYILNANPTSGYKLLMKADSVTLYYLHRYENGARAR